MKYVNMHTQEVVKIVSQFEDKYLGTIYVLDNETRWVSTVFYQCFAALLDEIPHGDDAGLIPQGEANA